MPDNMDVCMALSCRSDSHVAKKEIGAAVSSFKYHRDVKAAEEELSVEGLMDKIAKHGEGFEAFYGAVKPCYDGEEYYPTNNRRQAAWESFIRERYVAVRNHFGANAVVHAFDASGKTKDGKYKNSIHLIVSGAGYYQCGELVPRIDKKLFDPSVYKGQGKRQLFKLPFCKSADGCNRVFRRIENIETDPEVIADDSIDNIDVATFSQCLISNITGEEYKYIEPQIKATPKTNTGVLPVNVMAEKAFVELVMLCYETTQTWEEWID